MNREESEMARTKILLVDDEEVFLRTMEKRLLKRFMAVLVAASGEECLKKLGEEPDVDVVVLDVKMPGIDGIATLKEIKKRFPALEVIMLTGHGAFESAIEGMKLGAFDYLMKPADLQELVSKIDKARMKRLRRREKTPENADEDFNKPRNGTARSSLNQKS
jgi:DNA-binding NtrC family response regulator